MPIYSYTAFDSAGKERKGTVECATKEQAMQEVKANGWVVGKLNEAGTLNKDIELSIFKKKPKSRDLAVFCRQFVSIIDAGVQVTNALEMLGEQTENEMLATAIVETRDAIQAGSSFSEALSNHDDVFPGLLVTMVAAGEASGSLDVAFDRMATQFEKDAKMTAMMKKASIYPLTVLIVAFAVILLFLAYVIPEFEEILTGLGVALPWLTVMVLGASEFVQHYWYILFILGVGGGFALQRYSKTYSGQKTLGAMMLKLPLFGTLIVKSSCARFSRTLSTMIAAGIGITEALDIVANVLGNIHFKESIISARSEVTLGTPLSEPLERAGLFPPLVYHMVKIGEDTGDLENMLDKLADYYDEEVEMATQSLMAALEPMIIVFLAVIIGTVVMAVILPMAEMYAGLDNL